MIENAQAYYSVCLVRYSEITEGVTILVFWVFSSLSRFEPCVCQKQVFASRNPTLEDENPMGTD